VPEYFFSISDTSETLTFMKTAPQDLAPICTASTSGTKPQNVLPISAVPSLSILNTAMPCDTSPEEVTPSRLSKIEPVPKLQGNIPFAILLFPLKKSIMQRKSKRIKKEIKSNSRGKSKE
jgi:hypothetical protein